MQSLKVNWGSFYCKHTIFIFIIDFLNYFFIIILFFIIIYYYYYYYYYYFYFLNIILYICLCVTFDIEIIVRRWFAHLGDSVPIVGRGHS